MDREVEVMYWNLEVSCSDENIKKEKHTSTKSVKGEELVVRFIVSSLHNTELRNEILKFNISKNYRSKYKYR